MHANDRRRNSATDLRGTQRRASPRPLRCCRPMRSSPRRLSSARSEKLVKKGNPNSISDVGVAALCARTAVIGAYLNVVINSKDYTDIKDRNRLLTIAKNIQEKAIKKEEKIIKLTMTGINNSS